MFCDCFIFINVIPLIKVFFGEIKSIISIVIYRFYKWIRTYGQTRVIFYIILCTVNAFILVFCINYFLWIAKLRIHYFYYLKPSTISVQLGADLRNSDYKLPELQSYERLHSYQILSNGKLTYEGSYAKINNVRAPLCSKVYYRVPGEDVQISCDAVIWKTELVDYKNITFTGIYRSYFWKQNSKPVQGFHLESYRKDTSFYLEIRSVRPEDFSKEISFWGETSITYPDKVLTVRIKIGYFFLQVQKSIEHYVHVPNGYVLNIQTLKFYAQSTYDDLVVSYNVSSIVSKNVSGDTSTLCNKKFDGCSPFVQSLYKDFYNIFFDKRELNSIQLSFSNNAYFANSLSCVCDFVMASIRSLCTNLPFLSISIDLC